MMKYVFTIFLALSYELDAENLSRSVVFDYALDRPFDDDDSTMALDMERQSLYLPRTLFDGATEVVYEATVMEGSTLARFLVSAEIGNEDLLVSVHDLVTILGDCIYAVETVS